MDAGIIANFVSMGCWVIILEEFAERDSQRRASLRQTGMAMGRGLKITLKRSGCRLIEVVLTSSAGDLET
jgi:hypothetical protein